MDDPEIAPPVARVFPDRNCFDEAGYLYLYPDIAAGVDTGAIESGWQHFSVHGFAEGRHWLTQRDPMIGVSREIAPNEQMYLGNTPHYFNVGISALRCIETALFSAQRSKESIKTILDLPCGHGRVLRFLKNAFPAAQLTACDLNRDGVDFCAKTFDAIPVYSQTMIEAIPLAQNYYDLIWCGSLLTHLTEEACAAFVRQFQQFLRPGGIAVFTTHGRKCALELLTGRNKNGLTDQQISELLSQLRQDGFGYVDYADQPGYGFNLVLPSVVMAKIIQPSTWHLLGYNESAWDRRQDVVCLQRPWPNDTIAASSRIWDQ